jgi:lysozyme
MDNSLIEMVARHEGFRATVYCDACGKTIDFYRGDVSAWECDRECKGGNLTVGFGTRVDGAGIDKGDAQCLLANRLQRDHEELMREPWYAALDDRRRDAILDMSYTMGVAGVFQFKQMIAALQEQRWTAAAHEVLESQWFKQAPRRAAEIATLLVDG